MTSTANTVGAIALAVVMLSGVAARANPADTLYPPTQASAAYPAQPAQRADWHYEWRYHYSRHGEWVPGWIAVLNSRR